ncbi:E3 ubiquitin-protein ligase HUWE1 isoform X2 [Onthophagus taurus]|uniref:E3 ubiquitin-protein ligase HUWE1 isoform X2 n=1 Tax=Onthophagus taurus TaxID=166361 RepID=UPI0039BE1545
MAESVYYNQINDQSDEGSVGEDTRAMKIDHNRIRKSTTEPPSECKVLIDRLKKCNRLQLLEELSKINTWTFGKCELGHWKEVLHLFDAILDEATESHPENKWALNCDWKYNISDKKLLLWILHFTTLLIEHSFSRHTYKSMDTLLVLLGSSDMCVVLGVLNLLYIFSKRSNFITRMHPEQRSVLISRLHHLAESWGGKENGFGLADCCSSTKPMPPSATTLHFEFHIEHAESKDTRSKQNMSYIHIPHVDQIRKMPAEIMKSLLSMYNVPADKEMLLFTHLRLAYHFSNYRNRLLCVQARLQALSVLVYANALQGSAHTLLYNGLLEELVELIELKFPYLVEIRSAALRTLTSIIHLDRNPEFPKKPGSRLNNIIDVTGANQYHGFLPVLVRHCITCLTTNQNEASKDKTLVENTEVEELEEELQISEDDAFPYLSTHSDYKGKFPQPLATALFSFLYHLASYEAGGDALVSCGMMESLLQVINWHGVELEHITFVTRAVRVIDLITNIDMQAFYTHAGLQSFINRLDVEVNLCVKEHLYEFKHITSEYLERAETSESTEMEGGPSNFEFQYNPENSGKTCLPQRAALLKSMLNFLKKALQDSTFSEHIRHIMEGTLPNSLKHIISNAEYYGPSLFLLATDVVTVYVFQEPSLLSTIQDNGLTDVVLQALLIKDVPATREVLASLPNVFSALCLNARGLASFVKCKPFERLFKVLLSPTYLSAMRKRRSSDPMGDAASNLGNAMDELMRHQPSLKVDATAAIIKLLNELCQLGTDPKYICWRPHSKTETSPTPAAQRSTSNTEGSSDDEEEDDEEEASTSSQTAQTDTQETHESPNCSEKTPIALTEYILNVTKFIDAILSNNSTDDHCKEFVNQGGLVPLLRILGLPNLPVDCPVTNSAQAVASVCKSILNLAHEPKVLEEGLSQLEDVLLILEPLYLDLDLCSGSKLLNELADAPHLETAFSTESATPILHAMGAAHGYILMFVHVCRTGQNDIRTLSLQHWGSDKGLEMLNCLEQLYMALVWESTLLLALCSDDVIPSDCDFGREDMERLNIPVADRAESSGDSTGNVASAMEALTTNPPTVMDVDTESHSSNKPTTEQLRYIKPLLGASSRLGRALAELFGLLVKLCVGSPMRQRRGQNMVPTPSFPIPNAGSVATALNSLLANSLSSDRLPPSPVPKFQLTFLICSVGFTSPMLFDEKRYPYHLMLQRFVRFGGQDAFFNTFRWALSAGDTIPLGEGIEHPNLPEGTGEFLDAWLTLLEKMVNPKAILDSPHVITTKSQGTYKSVAFDPLKYLIQIHKLAFDAVMLLWGKKPLPNYGIRMSESILTILRHILRGEKIIKDRLNKQDDKSVETSSTAAPSTVATNNRLENDVNQESLRQLIDMGFTREHATEALMHTMNVEQATDYLLTHPLSGQRTVGMDLDMSEDDQVIQAIAISLGEAGPSTETKKKEDDDVTPLSEEQIDNFTEGALQICLNLVEEIPESVFKVCDLLVTIMKRKGSEFRDQLLKDFCEMLRVIYAKYEAAIDEAERLESPDLFVESFNSLRLAHYTHLLTLFFEVPPYFDMKGACGLAIFESGLIPHFVKLMGVAERALRSNQNVTVPKWLTPVILLLDCLGKVAVSTRRKNRMHCVTKRLWKWYDVLSGKWQTYSPANNKIINEAYWNGEQSTRITCGRRRYTISFTNMQQINEESSNNRPICMTPINLTLDRCSDGNPEFYETKEHAEVTLTEKEAKRCVPIAGFCRVHSFEIVRCCVKLINANIDKDTLHAIMRLCLRLTQEFDLAKEFVVEGGITRLLQLKENMAFVGFRTLATLLIRHTLEGPSTLAYAMEKVMRGRTLPSTPPPYKELMFMLRSLGSAVSRDPERFLEVAKNTLRIDISSFRRSEEADSRMPMKTEPSNRTQAPQIKEQESIDVIYELLNALILPIDNSTSSTEDESFDSRQPPNAQNKSSTRESMSQRATLLLNSNAGNSDVLNIDGPEEFPRVRLFHAASEMNLDPKNTESLRSRQILAKHNILKILADAVVSYAGVAKIITEYSYKAKSGEHVTEECTCLAFLFDKILPIVEEVSDRDCSIMCKNLISGIASCNHSPDAQSALVTEVKAALIRALLLTESTEKHKRIQHITTMILNMIEQCPPVQQVRIFKAQTFNANVNNIARLMLRKGIFNDLARVPYCLDMSSPNFPNTINSALKPMECLSKIVNQPITGNVTGNIKKRPRINIDDNGTTHSGTTSTEATNAQGEETVEDTENTEHDVASSLEGNPISSNAMDANVLDDIMERLLERGPNVALDTTMDLDDDTNMGFEHERDATEELMSTDSGESEDEVDDDENDEDNEVEDGDGDGDDNDDDDDEDEDIDEGDEDDEDNNYDDFENNRDGNLVMVRCPDDRDESIGLIRYDDNGFAIPLFEEATNTSDQSAPTTHPLLVSRHNADANAPTASRTQRANRTRRYQYLQLGTRGAQPPVILQRLLGPAAQNIHLSSNQMLNSPGLRDSARVVVMDNFGIFPSVEEQIDFVDQGYLFGPSMMATINHIPVALHWWKEESRFIDGESMHDIVTYICNRLVPTLLKHKCLEMQERKRKSELEEKTKQKFKPVESRRQVEDDAQEPSSGNTTTVGTGNTENRTDNMENTIYDSDEEIDGVVPIDDPRFNIANTSTPMASISSENQLEQQLIRVVNSLDGTSQSDSSSLSLPNLPPLPSPLDVDPSRTEEAQEQRDEPSEEHQEEDAEDESVDTQSGTSNLFSNVYQRTYPFNTPSLLRPLFHYHLPLSVGSTESSADLLRQMDSQIPQQQSAAPQNNEEGSSSQSSSGDQASTSQEQTGASDNARNSEVNEDIPEGVDPSFLDALPPEMRREVLEQHRLLRLQQRMSSTTTASTSDQATASGSNEVSPEFLAALPPSLQEEVLTQQRLEQQRQAAAHANPDEPVDAGAFFETLQPSLRTMILSDMEESQMSVLPPDLAAEAQTLRRDWEARNRQIVQERFFHSNLTTIIRHSARGGRTRFTSLLPHRQHWNWASRGDTLPQSSTAGNIKIRGRQLLDHESLSCLLVLLFVDDPKLNTGRLHRVIRNLCYHIPTRDWVVKALLSIIDRSVHVKPDESLNKPKRLPRPGPLTSKLLTDSKNMGNGANWLNIRMEAALGCHANVFIVNRATGKRNNVTISIHPQAAPIVCKHALDLFTSLSRSFPTFLLPLKAKDKTKTPAPIKSKNESTDFWDMLLKLDAASTKKGKSLAKTHSNLNLNSETENTALSFEQSAFGQLLIMLSSPVIQASIPLTDKLLRLLSVISTGMPELAKSSDSPRSNRISWQNFESVSAPEVALNLAVNVLTYKSCSEEGLEEVTTLLLNLSNCSVDMSFTILNLLLKGALRIGEIVRTQIQAMLVDLKNVHLNNEHKKSQEDVNPTTSKGVVNNRFTKETVVITASTKVKTSCDLQLPSMIPLTSKSSSQIFFLRVLRVIVQIRDAIKKSLEKEEKPSQPPLHHLSDQLDELENLWNTLSQCLLELEHTPDHHAVLVLQPAVEAFFLVHSPIQEALVTSEQSRLSTAPVVDPVQDSPETSTQGSSQEVNTQDNNGQANRAVSVPADQQKFLNFAEKHRTVLNQILRQTTAHLADGPFSVLVDHTRVLDFDIKRRYFRTELERLDQNLRREETAVHVRREHVFEDSFRELYRRTPEEWKNRFYIVFEDEEGQDAGGLLREWYMIISRDIFNPMYALFTVSPGDRVTYMINSASHYNPNHLCYYKFVGRVIAKAIYDNKLLECYFTRSFYKHILGIPVKYTDMESEDYSFYRGLVYLMENNINDLGCDLTFSTEINEFGVTETRDLIPNGRNVSVNEENKMEYVRRSCQMKMTGAIRQQLTAFLEGFYDIIPKRLISIFNEQELELLISGLPNVDIEDLKTNTEYHKYQASSLQIQWFWRALRSFDQADRAKFLQFVTGTSKVPLQGFGALEGMNGVQKFQIHRDDRSTDRLPSAHTCFNQLDLPVYETYDKLRSYLLKAIHECSEGFGFA